ncbi:MAG: SulP family inorganic anion transporter, partial [Thermodesulfobacteriota bacterium]|nr:SulP family inorganic anion transporter [Thermodesulfobacteriota bacterium]
IALITSLLGGTRIQCSGPTAPMSAVSAVVVAYAFEHTVTDVIGVNANQFVNSVFLLSAILLLIMAIFRMGRFIAFVPNVVISGFMSGIALLIWISQVQSIFGLGGHHALTGAIWQNVFIATTTVILIFTLGPLMRRIIGPLAHYLPPTLLAIVAVTCLTLGMDLDIERIQLSGSLGSWHDATALFHNQIPTSFSLDLLFKAFPFALQLALLCYLDTLLTSLVVDRMGGETTRQNRELAAQGIANSAIAFIGGIPGAQATIRSVLMLKEKASLRLAGIMVGIFVLLEIILFQDLLNQIPKAVFVGVLIKVGYDVFDFKPLQIYLAEFMHQRHDLLHNFFSRHDDEAIFVTNRELLMIAGTASITVFINLNVAVAAFTLFFYLHNKILFHHNPMRDLTPTEETEAFDIHHSPDE